MKISKHQIKRITAEEAGKLLGLLSDTPDAAGENIPEGLFLWKDASGDGKQWWVGMDNLDGYAWVEQFRTEYEAEHWLLGW